MNPYILVAKNTWTEITTYRLNFVMWRVRVFLQFITIYVLWMGLSAGQTNIFGYTQSLLLTYFLGTAFLQATVLSSRTQDIGENINNGDLSIFLIKPWGYFKYWFFRDIGDKAMNISFSIVEVAIIFLIFKPPFFLQTDLLYLIPFFISVILAIFLYFFFSSLLGMIGFWSPEIWAPRFLSYIVVFFFAGGLFPLDVFPATIYQIMQLLPFGYFLYFPLKIYLGQLDLQQIITGLTIATFWIFALFTILQIVWHQGLKRFGAEGR